MSRRMRLAALLLVLLACGGGAWLALPSGGGALATVLDEPFDEADLAAAVSLLESRGIPVSADSGQLRVPRDRVPQARSLLAYEGLLPRNTVSVFEQLARETDLWSTTERNEKRWQAAKMASLSKLIGMFPPVRSATVLYEPGSPRRLGNSGVEPTASVRVALKNGAAMDRKLVVAIADLVSGSISGMRRGNVRIIDNAGQSHRVDDEGALTADGRIEQLREAEQFYRDKVRSVLHYIDNVIVGLNVQGEGPAVRCLGASISVPRGYFAAVYRSSHADAREVADETLKPFIEPQLSKIQQAVMKIIGSDDPASVSVDWYYDVPAMTAAPAGPVGPSKAAAAWGATGWVHIAGWALAAAGVVTSACLLWLRRVRRRAGSGAVSGAADADGSDCPEAREPSGRSSPGNPFLFLRQVPNGDILALLQGEHPQTGAMILAHLPPAKSAAILDELPPPGQVEMARRIAGLDRIDAGVIRDVARGVAQRFSGAAGSDKPPGVAIVARILHHAGGATEQSVLAGLAGEEPALADSIRRRLLAFEDIALLPPPRLRAALETFDSDELAVALRTAADDLKGKVLSSLSPQAAQRVREEMERIGPVRLSDVEAAQQNVTEAVRRLSGGHYLGSRSGAGELLA